MARRRSLRLEGEPEEAERRWCGDGWCGGCEDDRVLGIDSRFGVWGADGVWGVVMVGGGGVIGDAGGVGSGVCCGLFGI